MVEENVGTPSFPKPSHLKRFHAKKAGKMDVSNNNMLYHIHLKVDKKPYQAEKKGVEAEEKSGEEGKKACKAEKKPEWTGDV